MVWSAGVGVLVEVSEVSIPASVKHSRDPDRLIDWISVSKTTHSYMSPLTQNKERDSGSCGLYCTVVFLLRRLVLQGTKCTKH